MLEFDVDTSAIDEIARRMAATDGQVELARTSALRKVNKRLETSLKRLTAKALRIPVRSIGDRFFSNSIAPGDDELRVWIGTWDVSPYSIGTPAQNSRGVRVGQRSYPGAFLAKIYGQQKVWIRLHSKHYAPDLYPTRYRPGDRGGSDLRGRFPVVRAAVPIDSVMRDLLAKEGPDIATEFAKVFAQELNYQVFVKGAKV